MEPKLIFKLKPFVTPNFVVPVMEPRPRQEGFSEIGQSIPIQSVSVETLAALCDEFRKNVFKKAGKEDPGTTPGLDLISEERLRQINEEGWSSQRDDEHRRGELACLAACYLLNNRINFPPNWDKKRFKIPRKPNGRFDRRRELVKAGALVAAEIDRFEREEARHAPEPENETDTSTQQLKRII